MVAGLIEEARYLSQSSSGLRRFSVNMPWIPLARMESREGRRYSGNIVPSGYTSSLSIHPSSHERLSPGTDAMGRATGPYIATNYTIHLFS